MTQVDRDLVCDAVYVVVPNPLIVFVRVRCFLFFDPLGRPTVTKIFTYLQPTAW